MKLTIEENCVRCGLCTDISDEIFELDKKNDVIKVKVAEVSDSQKSKAQEAIESCPVQAIKAV